MRGNRDVRSWAGRMLALALATAACAATAAPADAAGPTAAQAEALGKQAYDYGFPLLEILRVRREQTSVRCPDDAGNAPLNSFSHAGGFPRPKDRTVVAPNTDTLYSISHLDLSRGPIVLSHPRMGKRYYSFEFLDPYSNVIDIPGTRQNGGAAGKYAIRWTKGGRKARRMKGVPRGAEVIRSKYRRVWVIGRTLATNEKDQRKARKLMKRYRLKRAGHRPKSFPKNCKPGRPEEHPTPVDGPAFIEALNAAMKRNPPPRRDQPLLDELKPLGVGAGLDPERTGLSPDVLAALYKGVADEAAALPTTSKLKAFSEALKTNGWLLPAANIGDYGTDYEFRAFIATVGLGANTPDEAIYPAGLADGSGALYDAANDYRLTFAPGQAPPAKFFWSLTMYDIDGYLVRNPINRYSLGPSHPPLVKQPDGSIVIAIQQTKPVDPDTNWLPSAPGGFRLNLRLYGPTKAARSGAWRPPGVVKLPG